MKIPRLAKSLIVALALYLASPIMAADSGGEVLSNSDIVGLAQAGITTDLIIAKIQITPNTFDLSPRAMITLKENGVSDAVVSAMLASASSGRPALDEARFTRELENIAIGGSEARTSGIAWMVERKDEALPSLRRALFDNRAELREAALVVLGRLEDRDSLPAMRNLLTDTSAAVRQTTAQVLAEMNDQASLAAAETALARQVNPLDGYIRLIGYARLPQHAASLGTILTGSADVVNRLAAAWALGEIGRPGLAGRPALEQALVSDANPEVRREAALAVAKFRDADGALLLQNACRTDPQVRKVTLAAMAEYPETVGFLVGVMNLGADQIAADELETARASLSRLTGQDFGLDGVRWQDWYGFNSSRFPAGSTTTLSSLPPSTSPTLGTGTTVSSVSRPREVDLEAWSIVTNPQSIPMAPGADGQAPRSSVAPPPPLAGGFGPSGASPNEFSENVPSPGTSMFRTWSSDPDRPVPSPSDQQTTAGLVPRTFEVDDGMLMSPVPPPGITDDLMQGYGSPPTSPAMDRPPRRLP